MRNFYSLLLTSVLSFCALQGMGQAGACEFNPPLIQVNGNCQLSDVLFEADEIDGATYEWDFNGDNVVDQSGVDLNSVTHQYASTGTFKVKLSVSRDECSHEVFTDIFIVSRAKPIFSIDQMCDQIEVSNYSSGYDSMKWSVSDGSHPGKHSFTHASQ